MTWPAFSLGVWGYPERMDPRVPPGQFVTERFPILTYGETPRSPRRRGASEVTGLVETPLVLTYEDLLARPQVELTRDFHCVTRWSRLDVTWKGVRTRDLLEEARPRPEAVAALVESYGGYTTNLLLEDLLREDVLLAHTLFGKPLPPERGRPRPPPRAPPLRLEERQVGAPHRAFGPPGARLLGAAGLPLAGGPLEGGALPGGAGPRPPDPVCGAQQTWALKCWGEVRACAWKRPGSPWTRPFPPTAAAWRRRWRSTAPSTSG